MPRLRQAGGATLRMTLAASLVALLGGCGSGGAVDSATGLFHDLEGGVIAQQRPPPPGADDPYPNMGSIPARPAAPDIAAQQKLADQLAAQRDQAEQQAAANPLTPRAAPPAPPKPPAAPDPNANRVVVDAAPSPPAKPAADPAPAAPAPAPAAESESAIPALASVPEIPAALIAGPLPTLAAAPPPGPTGLGLAATQAVPAQAPAPAAPAATPAGNTVSVAFTFGSSVLPPSAPLSLRRFALAHKGVPVTITGRGEAVLPGVDPQSRALDLALRRAQAIAASLGSAGIPAANLRLRAEAAGQGGSASL